jgi:hypothetical protein
MELHAGAITSFLLWKHLSKGFWMDLHWEAGTGWPLRQKLDIAMVMGEASSKFSETFLYDNLRDL